MAQQMLKGRANGVRDNRMAITRTMGESVGGNLTEEWLSKPARKGEEAPRKARATELAAYRTKATGGVLPEPQAAPLPNIEDPDCRPRSRIVVGTISKRRLKEERRQAARLAEGLPARPTLTLSPAI
jgi:hypothetical protein